MKWCDETLFSWLTTHNHISATMCESSRIICHRQRIQCKALLCELCKIDFALRIYTLLYTILIFPSLSNFHPLHNRKFLTTVLQCNELRNHLFLCANWPFVNMSDACIYRIPIPSKCSRFPNFHMQNKMPTFIWMGVWVGCLNWPNKDPWNA